MVSKYDKSNIPRWKRKGLNDKQIQSLIFGNGCNPHKDPKGFEEYIEERKRDLSSELEQILSYLDRGLDTSEIARIINYSVSGLYDFLESKGYKVERGILVDKYTEEEK